MGYPMYGNGVNQIRISLIDMNRRVVQQLTRIIICVIALFHIHKNNVLLALFCRFQYSFERVGHDRSDSVVQDMASSDVLLIDKPLVDGRKNAATQEIYTTCRGKTWAT